MDQDQSFQIDTISLMDEDGVEHEFEIADAMELDGKEYMALIPVFDEAEDYLEDSGELVILRVGNEDGEEFLEQIPDDDEYDRVAEIFVKRLEEYYDFEEVDDSDPIKH